jgi:hypothetical protein
LISFFEIGHHCPIRGDLNCFIGGQRAIRLGISAIERRFEGENVESGSAVSGFIEGRGCLEMNRIPPMTQLQFGEQRTAPRDERFFVRDAAGHVTGM